MRKHTSAPADSSTSSGSTVPSSCGPTGFPGTRSQPSFDEHSTETATTKDTLLTRLGRSQRKKTKTKKLYHFSVSDSMKTQRCISNFQRGIRRSLISRHTNLFFILNAPINVDIDAYFKDWCYGLNRILHKVIC